MLRMKMWVSNWLLRHVLNLTTEWGKIDLKIVDPRKKVGHIYIDGVRLSGEEQGVLIEDARMALKLHGLKVVVDSIKVEATNNLINNSKVIDDMVYAKAMLYTIDILEKRLKGISELSQ